MIQPLYITGGCESKVHIYDNFVEVWTQIKTPKVTTNKFLFIPNGKIILLDIISQYDGVGKVDVFRRKELFVKEGDMAIPYVVQTVKRYQRGGVRACLVGQFIHSFPSKKFSQLFEDLNVDSYGVICFIHDYPDVVETNKRLINENLRKVWEEDRTALQELARCQMFIENKLFLHPMMRDYSPNNWGCFISPDIGSDNILADESGNLKFTDCFHIWLERKETNVNQST